YFATCLQLGDLWISLWNKMFFTEQMLASLRSSNFPQNFVKSEGHVPDGLTILQHDQKEILIGYEVDLNLKDLMKYNETRNYYYFLKKQLGAVFWLVRNTWMANRIIKELNSSDDMEFGIFCFIMLDDFQKNLWEAEIIFGKFKGHTLRKAHEKLMQSLGKTDATLGQKSMQPTFFSKYKSPQKSITSSFGGLLEKR
ncbi:MAG: hypothetical protein ACK5WZ_12975, partial [Pseudobdellovibrionaceae bacterium]